MLSGEVAPILRLLISSSIMSSSSCSSASRRAVLTSNESRLGNPEFVRGEGEMGGLNWKSVDEEEGGGVAVAIEILPFLSVSLTMAVVVDWSCDCCRCCWCVAPPTLSCPAARSHTLAITFTQL